MAVRKHSNPPLEPVEHASIDELRSIQLARLKSSLDHAYRNVPHYRKKFHELGVSPDDLKNLDDLAKFPFTLKDDLREQYPFGMFAVPREQVIRIHASSGTTGKPTIVGYTRNDLEMWASVVARSIRAAGGGAGDVVLISYGYGLFTGGLGAHYGAEKLGCTVIPMSGGQTEKQAQMIRDLRPNIIMCTPSYALAICEEFERQGFDPRASSLEIGILGAEPWTAAMRAEIECRWNMDALDIYGLSEVIGPGVASECVETKDGAVVWEDHFYPEIIDPQTGKVLADGTPGELVLTSLTKEALPVIRYRTRDLTCLLPPTARPMRRIAKIGGRSDDMLIIRGVNVFPSQIEELLFEEPRLAPQYQLVISRKGYLDNLEVNVELRPEPDGVISSEDISNVKHRLEHRIKAFIGVSASVQVRPPRTVERTVSGKAKRVIDQRRDATEPNREKP